MQCVAFSEVTTPFQRTEIIGEGSISLSSAHKRFVIAIEIAVIHSPFLVHSDLFFRLAERLAKCIYTPVIICIFKSTGCTLIYSHITRNIAEPVVPFPAKTSSRRDIGMDCIRSVLYCLPKGLDIISSDSLHICICDYGSRVIADHTSTMSRTCPFRQESALLICIDQTLLHLLVHFRIYKIQQREQAAESVPKTCVCKEISRTDFASVRAVMHQLSF